MGRDDDARDVRETAEETTVIGGGNERPSQAWSAVDGVGAQPGPGEPGEDGGPSEVFPRAWEPLSGPDAVPAAAVEPMPDPAEPGALSPSVPSPEDRQEPDAGPAPDPEPVLIAQGLGVVTKRGGWVFKDVDLTLRATSVAAIVGPAGTGRSSLLLALTGRMNPSAGTVTVAGHSGKDKPALVRALTSVARIGSVITPEAGLTVRESVDERCLIDDVPLSVGRTRFAEACTAMQLDVDPSALVGTLVGPRATLVAVALAAVRVSAVIVLDDLDRGVSAATQQTLLDALIGLARTGPAIVVSTTDRIPVMEADVVLDLTPADGPAIWQTGIGLPAAAASRLPLHPGDRPPGNRELETGSGMPDPVDHRVEGFDQDDPPTQVIDVPRADLSASGDPVAEPNVGWSSPQWPAPGADNVDWPAAGPGNVDWPTAGPAADPSAGPGVAGWPAAEPPAEAIEATELPDAQTRRADPPGSPNTDSPTKDPR